MILPGTANLTVLGRPPALFAREAAKSGFTIGVLLWGVAYSITNAVWPAIYAERFPTQVCLSGMAIGTQFGFAMAGFAPLIETALIGKLDTAPFELEVQEFEQLYEDIRQCEVAMTQTLSFTITGFTALQLRSLIIPSRNLLPKKYG